ARELRGRQLPRAQLPQGLRHPHHPHAHAGAMMSRARPAPGFTLAELVMVLVIIGILAALLGPRMVSNTGFLSRGFYDESLAVVRFAQKTAIAWRRPVVVCIAADG